MATRYIHAGDTKALTATLLQGNGKPMNLTGCTATFAMRHSAGTPSASGSCVISDAAKGRVSYTWGAGQTATAGVYDVLFGVTDAQGKLESVPSEDFSRLVIRASLP